MFGDTPLVMVEDAATLIATCDRLKKAPAIGVDTEGDSFHHYREKVCLIQLSDLEQDYIVDPLQFDDLSPLGEIMANPEQVKILHGADYDVVCLKRDFGFEFSNLFDTMISAQFLGFSGVGLADLIRRYFGVHIDKQYQRHDWSKRPLLQEHLDYARGDTHWLPALRELLTRELERADRLDAVLEESRFVEAREWTERAQPEAQFLRVKGSGTLDDSGKRVLRAVWEYRDKRAQSADRPAFKIIPDAVLLAVAHKQPGTPRQMNEMARQGSSMMRRHGDSLLEAVAKGLKDDRDIPELKVERKKRAPRSGPGIDRLLGPLKDWRNARVKREGISPVAVVNNALLKEIARVAPATLEELASVPGIRQWQLKDLGEDLLGVIEKVPPAKEGSGGGRRRRNRSRNRKSGGSTESSD